MRDEIEKITETDGNIIPDSNAFEWFDLDDGRLTADFGVTRINLTPFIKKVKGECDGSECEVNVRDLSEIISKGRS